MTRDSIQPVRGLTGTEGLERYRSAGIRLLPSIALIKLNGGLGTSMGLMKPKSLIAVKEGLNFLDLIARQTLALRRGPAPELPLIFMNSFRTDRATLDWLSRYDTLRLPHLALSFVQSRVPKILEGELRPAVHAEAPELEWCPPGHGDLYTALSTSGILDLLLDRGIEYAFIANADNLGAGLDAGLLGYIVEHGIRFLMEVAERTDADRKGGHLCRLADGRLALRESAQTPPGERDEFQDIERYCYFNTNNIWVHLPTLSRLLERHGGVLPLPTIVNRKHLDPRDPLSPRVIQLETAMGAAISLFPHAAAIHVPRSRFSPVKTTNDLLGVRSDAYELTGDSRLILRPQRKGPPTILLDERFYKHLDLFEQRFPEGPPSLVDCCRLEVVGNVLFEKGVLVRGEASILAGEEEVRVPRHTVLNGRLDLTSRC